MDGPSGKLFPGRSQETDEMFLKIAEDFKNYTLQALPTLVEKLAYISALQNQDGSYTHWGLSRSFGDQKTQKAIRAAHSELLLELLRRPINSLHAELSSVRDSQPEGLKSGLMKLSAPSTHDALLSVHLRLVHESLVAVEAQAPAGQPVA